MGLFVASLPYSATESDVRQLFGTHGFFTDNVKIMTDRETGKSRGFGFVDLDDPDREADCIEQMNGMEMDGRKIVVERKKPREDNRGGGGFRGGGQQRDRHPGRQRGERGDRRGGGRRRNR